MLQALFGLPGRLIVACSFCQFLDLLASVKGKGLFFEAAMFYLRHFSYGVVFIKNVNFFVYNFDRVNPHTIIELQNPSVHVSETA